MEPSEQIQANTIQIAQVSTLLESHIKQDLEKGEKNDLIIKELFSLQKANEVAIGKLITHIDLKDDQTATKLNDLDVRVKPLENIKLKLGFLMTIIVSVVVFAIEKIIAFLTGKPTH